jgi:hypothetical protein
MTPARAWQWIIATRARRSALTLAMLAAIASPFATGWYDPNKTDYQRHVDASEEERARIIELWGEDLPTADCEQLTEQLAQRELPARFKDKNQSLYEYWWKDERERKNWFWEVRRSSNTAVGKLINSYRYCSTSLSMERSYWRRWW